VSTTAVYPKCAKCGLEIVGTALIFYGSNRIWHPECLAASPSPASPADDVAGLREHDDLAQRLEGRAAWYENVHPGAVKTPQLLCEAAAALSRLQAELDKAKAEQKYFGELHEREWRSQVTRAEAAEASAATMREALTAAQKTLRSFNLQEPKVDAALGGQHG
jgi:hypothetical protein